MSFFDETKRDVFIIHTKADSYESQFVEALKDQLDRWGLSPWVYEDWEWETEGETGVKWRSTGRIDQLDIVRHMTRHPEPFKHRQKGPEPDRDALARMFESSGAIVVVAPRAVTPSGGCFIELEVLQRAHYAPVTGVSWDPENAGLIKDVGAVFDYRMPSPFSRDFKVASESVARVAWLTCVMARLTECGPMGWDLFMQIAQNDALLNRIARRSGRRMAIPLKADPDYVPVVPDSATADSCRPVVEFWLGGPGFTADRLTSGKPPWEIIEASKFMRYMLHAWCEQAKERFPDLEALNAEVGLALGAAKMRLAGLGKSAGVPLSEAIDELTAALEAPNVQAVRTAILLNRGLAWAESGFLDRAITDYSEALKDQKLDAVTRFGVLRNRAIACIEAGRYADAERDVGEALSQKPLSVFSEALALITRARLRYRTDLPEEALADYGRILALKKAPAEARIQALLNRGALLAGLNRHSKAIADYNAVLGLRETSQGEIAKALLNRADSSAQMGDAAGALEDYQAVLQQADIGEEMRAEVERRVADLKG
jgi:tetratricopeptide (TPR) repeat protein